MSHAHPVQPGRFFLGNSLGLGIAFRPGPGPVPQDPTSVHFWVLLQKETPELSTQSLSTGAMGGCSPWSRCHPAVGTCSPLPISASIFVPPHSLQPTDYSQTRKTTSLSKQNILILQGNTTLSRRTRGIVFSIPWWAKGHASYFATGCSPGNIDRSPFCRSAVRLQINVISAH